jgi:hypothetical protein
MPGPVCAGSEDAGLLKNNQNVDIKGILVIIKYYNSVYAG